MYVQDRATWVHIHLPHWPRSCVHLAWQCPVMTLLSQCFAFLPTGNLVVHVADECQALNFVLPKAACQLMCKAAAAGAVGVAADIDGFYCPTWC